MQKWKPRLRKYNFYRSRTEVGEIEYSPQNWTTFKYLQKMISMHCLKDQHKAKLK
jgi:hypothetical protein